MILPKLPSKFSGGEILTASKLNTLIDWMRDVARLLPSLQISTGRGLSFSRGSAGTTISLAHGYVQGSGGEAEAELPDFPLKVSVRKSDEGKWLANVTAGIVNVAPDVLMLAAAFAPGSEGFVNSLTREIPEGGTTISLACAFEEYKTLGEVHPFDVSAYGEITIDGKTHSVHCTEDGISPSAEYRLLIVSGAQLVFSSDALATVFPGAFRTGRIVAIAQIFPVKNADGELTGYTVSQRHFGDVVVPALRYHPQYTYRV